MIEITTSEDIKNMYLVKDECVFTPLFIYGDYNSETDTYTDFKIIKTAEQVYQEWLEQKDLPPQPDKIEILDKRVAKLINGQMKMEKRQQEIEESQLVQDMLIDDIVFEVIPTLEQQINVNNIKPNEIGEILLNNKNKKENGVNAMAAYLAQKIIEGRDYATVFKTKTYRQYQDEVDTILELEGRGDLIKRSYI